MALCRRQWPAANQPSLSWSYVLFGPQNGGGFLICINFQHLKTGNFHMKTQMSSVFLRNCQLKEQWIHFLQGPWDRALHTPGHPNPPGSLHPFTFLVSIGIWVMTPLSPKLPFWDTLSDCSNKFLSGLYIPNMSGPCFRAVEGNERDFRNRWATSWH